MSSPITEAATKVHAVLEPLTSDERRRVVQAVLTLLGDEALTRGPAHAPGGADLLAGGDGTERLPAKARSWMTKSGLTVGQLERYFHFDNDRVSCIELAGNGKSKREKAINTYLQLGVAALLGKGEAEFTDDEARQLCEHFGCYDGPNHARTIKDFGNAITGSKAAGWKLTAPGLIAAATLLKS